MVSPPLTLFYKQMPTLQLKVRKEALHCTLQHAEETTRSLKFFYSARKSKLTPQIALEKQRCMWLAVKDIAQFASFYVLDNGADIKVVTADNRTPLHNAILNGHSDVATKVLNRG